MDLAAHRPPLWRRLTAQALDWLMAFGPPAGLMAVALVVDRPIGGESTTLAAILVALSLLTLFTLPTLALPALMARSGERNGQTLGKQLLGVRIVRRSGRPIDFGLAFFRETVIKLGAGFITTLLFLLVDALWSLADHDGRPLHDILVNTAGIHADSPRPLTPAERARQGRWGEA